MKLNKLLAYAVIGIIGGLLLENKALIIKQMARDKSLKLKTKLGKSVAG